MSLIFFDLLTEKGFFCKNSVNNSFIIKKIIFTTLCVYFFRIHIVDVYLLAQSAIIPPSLEVKSLVGLARMSSNPVVFS